MNPYVNSPYEKKPKVKAPEDPIVLPPEPTKQRGRQPRNCQDRSKYQPHNGTKECLRRIRQVCHDQLSMAGVEDVQNFIIQAAVKEAERVLAATEAGTDPTPTPGV